ncbi:hypothetical protein [Nonomuraea gerenzanensis]|uniref:hypothetical protein n=1 Tax=Nonomuraea gerenzanensis TaxID=93944 RepID=UPI001CDA4E26|nr:hypothetical protein [Nonomuraea gerenzanensis]UBU12686.1 hypothetical protein LCN96_51925 [Nonomuraea gerenzanensis]
MAFIPPDRPPRPPAPAIVWKTYLTGAAVSLVLAIYAAVVAEPQIMTALATISAGFAVAFIRTYIRRRL